MALAVPSRSLWDLFQPKICLPGISPQHWPMGFPPQKAPIPLSQP